MARNKYPEETVKKILDVSLKLFLEKGYEHTTVQDIVDNLGGLSKGAIYHHFKSKEDILQAASDYLFSQEDTDEWAAIRDDPNLNALEKFQKLVTSTLWNPQEIEFRNWAPVQAKTPRFLVSRMKRTVELTAPAYIQPILEQGIAEGFLETDFPKEVAEVVLLLVNIWLDTSVFPVSDVDFLRKLLFLAELCEKYGVKDLFNEKVMESIETNIAQTYNQKQKERQAEEA